MWGTGDALCSGEGVLRESLVFVRGELEGPKLKVKDFFGNPRLGSDVAGLE